MPIHTPVCLGGRRTQAVATTSSPVEWATLASMVCDILDGWRAFPYGLSGQDGATGSGMCTF